MKKALLLIIAASFTLELAGQAPILDMGDVGAVGSTYIMGRDTNVISMDPGASGPSVNWDFSMLGYQSIDSIKYVSPASTGHAADFPTADLAITISDVDGGYAFADLSSSALEGIGVAGDVLGVGTPMVLHFNPTQTLTPFPFTYGDSFLDTTGISYRDTTSLIVGFDSVAYTSTIYRDVNGDAWGTVQLYAGTFTSLRMRTYERTHDIIEGHSPFFGWVEFSNTESYDTSYAWWSEARGYILCEMNISNGKASSISYQDPNVVGVDNPTLNTAKVDVFPNPSNGMVNLRTADIREGDVSVTDLRGAVIYKTRLVTGSATMDLSQFSAGLYIYTITDHNGSELARGKFTLQD